MVTSARNDAMSGCGHFGLRWKTRYEVGHFTLNDFPHLVAHRLGFRLLDVAADLV